MAIVPAWASSVLFGGWDYNRVLRPRYANVLGYDGFVHAIYKQVGATVAPFGGWCGASLPLALMAIIVITAWAFWRRGSLARTAGRTMPFTILLLAAASLAIQRSGHWDVWFFNSINLYHLGRLVPLPRWDHIVSLIAATGLVGGSLAGCVSLAWVTPRHDRLLIRGVLLLATVLWGLSFVLAQHYHDLHSTRVLSEAAWVWCLTALAIESVSPGAKPSTLASVLSRWGPVGTGMLHVMLFVLAPGHVLAMFIALEGLPPHRLAWFCLLLGPTGVIMALQGLHLEVLRIRRERRHRQVECPRCQYDLRGTVAAGRRMCPECGQPIDDIQYRWVFEQLSANLRQL